MNRYLLLLLVGLSVVFSSCQKDSEVTSELIEPTNPTSQSDEYPNVDSRLWPFYQSFEEEAAARGINIDLRASGVSGVIEEIEEDQVAGRCSYYSHRSNHVTIDESFWEIASDRFREFIIFHELGHCQLLRDHREDAYPNGSCISIMRSGLGDCRDNYTPLNRSTYLNELFSPTDF